MNFESGKLASIRSGDGRSPFRYPGGKAFFAETLSEKLETLPAGQRAYLEPYAGGAGSAIRLLAGKLVSKIYLNDADPRVFSAWHAILHENGRFLEALASIELNMTSWREQKAIVDDPTSASDTFALGFATFFLNRTNRSGIVQGAGPIGGYEQTGKWKLDVRFNRSDLVRRMAWLGRHKSQILISNEDGLEFLKRTSGVVDLDRSLYFIDPPYVAAGSRLYMNGMRARDHRRLAAYLCSGMIPNWIVTYDDCQFIRDLYKSATIDRLDVQYSLQKKRTEGEVLITPS